MIVFIKKLPLDGLIKAEKFYYWIFFKWISLLLLRCTMPFILILTSLNENQVSVSVNNNGEFIWVSRGPWQCLLVVFTVEGECLLYMRTRKDTKDTDLANVFDQYLIKKKKNQQDAGQCRATRSRSRWVDPGGCGSRLFVMGAFFLWWVRSICSKVVSHSLDCWSIG